MTKTWVIGAVVTIALAIGLWYAMKNSSPASTTVPNAAESSSGSLMALVAKGGTVQCQVNHGSGTEATQGTVFVSGKNVRGDFTSTVPQVGRVESHMISDGEYVYVWSSMMATGMKMKANTTEESTPGQSSQASQMYTQNYDYNCSPWSNDDAKFQLPASITFKDMSAIASPPAGASTGAGAKLPAGVNCAMCDQAPNAAAKAQCKAAMGCK